ncbi:hypothetical protein BGX26_002715 [Mortierella sp. AD094]|nr:hypothetical protein BGX26_002715 [Mortierella sp. AD094]
MFARSDVVSWGFGAEREDDVTALVVVIEDIFCLVESPPVLVAVVLVRARMGRPSGDGLRAHGETFRGPEITVEIRLKYLSVFRQFWWRGVVADLIPLDIGCRVSSWAGVRFAVADDAFGGELPFDEALTSADSDEQVSCVPEVEVDKREEGSM